MKQPLGVQPVQYEPVTIKRANRKSKPAPSIPMSGPLVRKLTVKPFDSTKKVPLEAIKANATKVSLAPEEPQVLNLSSTGNRSITNKGFPRGFPRNKLNQRIKTN